MKSERYYEIDGRQFRISKTRTGAYLLKTVDNGTTYNNLFHNLESAMVEILSYSEIDEDDYNTEED